jgi:hypothetical protein
MEMRQRRKIINFKPVFVLTKQVLWDIKLCVWVIAFTAFQRDVLPSSPALCVRKLAHNLRMKAITILLELRERIAQPQRGIFPERRLFKYLHQSREEGNFISSNQNIPCKNVKFDFYFCM